MRYLIRAIGIFSILVGSIPVYAVGCISSSLRIEMDNANRMAGDAIRNACSNKSSNHEDAKIGGAANGPPSNISGIAAVSINLFKEQILSSCSPREISGTFSQEDDERWIKLYSAMSKGDNSYRYQNDIDNSKLSTECRSAISSTICRSIGSKCPASSGTFVNRNNFSGQTRLGDQRDQQQSQQNQQAQQSAQQSQSRADQQRQGQRKTHDPAAEAHECIAIDKAGSGNFGAFKNQCPYPVNFITCNEKPRTIQGGFNWSADFDCAKQQFGLHTPKGNSSVAAHNRNTEFVHWFACKAPVMPTDGTYVPGKGIEARCHN